MSSPARSRLSEGWQVCRADDDYSLPCETSWSSPALPTTALFALLAGGLLEGLGDPYYSTNLLDVPDINATGRGFYTLRWERHCDRGWLEFGANYRAFVSLDGSQLEAPFAGMWARQRYWIPGSGLLGIVVEPPDHVGSPVQGQGGDHELAKDLSSQFLLGWDWQAAIPDRSTGFIGAVEFATEELFLDPAVITREINGTSRLLTAMARFTEFQPCLQVEVSVDGVSVGATATVRNATEFSLDFIIDDPVITGLWWPLGVASNLKVGLLHTGQFSGQTCGGGVPVLRHREIKFGIRKFEKVIDPKTKGPAFLVNGMPLFLTGGNWIATDAAWRYSADKDRYRAEIGLHVAAGLNAIRVWGGGIIETEDFYTVADELGIVVYQEFGFSGDNNGRWAGSYDWPLDSEGAKVGAEAIVRYLRKFASIFLIGGGNELYPSSKSPPQYIKDTRSLIEAFAIYIDSSMDGGVLGGNETDHNSSYALVAKDGPYGMLVPRDFSNRNPGMATDVIVSVQPEIGSCALPSSLTALRKFLAPEDIDAILEKKQMTNAAWTHHRYETLDINNTYDPVAAYGFDIEPSEWLVAANLALHQQTQLLFESYLNHIFDWYAGVFLWKSQSPWPALRGFLYDWYLLEPNGNWRGTRSALRSWHSATFDIGSSTLRLVNRDAESWDAELAYEWIDFSGVLGAGSFLFADLHVPPRSAKIIGTLAVPCTCFLRLTWPESQQIYWVSTAETPDYSFIGDARRRRNARATAVLGCDEDLFVDLTVVSSSDVLFYPTFDIPLSSESESDPIRPTDWASRPRIVVREDANLLLLPGTTARFHLDIVNCTPGLTLLVDAVNLAEGPLRIPMTCCSDDDDIFTIA